MTLFPSFSPLYSSPKSSSTSELNILFGDGYKKSFGFGLNRVAPEWQLEWLIDQSTADIIDGFLQTSADNAEFFQWQPPDSSYELNWRCDEWSVELANYNLYRIQATFIQVFELSIPTFAPVLADCASDMLCEPDFGGNLGNDLWVSRIYSPISNIDPQTAGTQGSPNGLGGTFIDSQGYNYQVWTFRRDTSGFSTAPSQIVITKRDIAGEIIWTKELYGVDGYSSYWYLLYCNIIDVNDGFGESLVMIASRVINLNQAGFPDYRATFISVSLTSGSINKEYWFSGPGGYLGTPAGSWPTTVGVMSYIKSLNEFYMVSSDYIWRWDPRTGTHNGGHYLFTTGGYIAPYYPEDQTVIDFGDDGYGNKKTLALIAIYNASFKGLCLIPYTNRTPDSSDWKVYTSTATPGQVGSVSAVKYGSNILAVTNKFIYVLNQSGDLVKRLTIPYEAIGQVGIKLDQDNNRIYIWGNWVDGNINGVTMCLTLSYDLTTFISAMRVNAGQNNIYTKHGTPTGGFNILGGTGNRVVFYMDTLAGYGQSASGGRALVMVAGFRASKIGSASLSAGGFTATISGTSYNTSLTDSTATASFITLSPPTVQYPSAGTISSPWSYIATPSGSTWQSATMIRDATQTWLYNIYGTDLS
jgi:phage-related protein